MDFFLLKEEKQIAPSLIGEEMEDSSSEFHSILSFGVQPL